MEHINIPKQRAFQFLQHTACNIFLTGKAGTGKTTFLRELRAQQLKRIVVVAPTGVAAMNAQGVTIHSLFQLPFTPYLPGRDLLKNNRYSKAKINLLRSIDILVIDEISMVRSDTLDAVSSILRRYRNKNEPFGGVQLLLIGDLQQLAPVVKEDEWAILSQHYATPFFFDSLEFKQTHYYPIELTHIYRQSDERFVSLLNQIRSNQVSQETLTILNARYNPNAETNGEEGYITLTTHNAQAQRINRQQMTLIGEPEYLFEAKIEGDFPEYLYPTDAQLQLKKGAQVMFIQNDASGEKRYYNGKLGWVDRITQNSLFVRTEENTIEVTKGEWKNIKYSVDEKTQEIVEEVEGVFKQYPLRQAYAITIHKSQGLTFDKVIIDAAAAFAHGQVYVALSRCRTLEGILLRSKITPQALVNDHRVDQYTQAITHYQPGNEELQRAQRDSYVSVLQELFDFKELFILVSQVAKIYFLSLKSSYPQLTERWCRTRDELKLQMEDVSLRFQKQLYHLVHSTPTYEEDLALRERIVKGAIYFTTSIQQLLLPLSSASIPDVDNKEVHKQLKLQMEELIREQELKLTLFDLVQNPFTISDYYRTRSKMKLEIPQKAKERTVKNTPVQYEEIKHQALYEQLRQWRNQEAAELNLPVYTVLQQKALIGIANTIPTTKKELLSIHGIGKRVIEKYGVKILEIVDNYRLFPQD